MVFIPKVDAKVTLLFVLEKSCSKYRKDLFVLQRGILSFNMMVIPKATGITQKGSPKLMKLTESSYAPDIGEIMLICIHSRVLVVWVYITQKGLVQ